MIVLWKPDRRKKAFFHCTFIPQFYVKLNSRNLTRNLSFWAIGSEICNNRLKITIKLKFFLILWLFCIQDTNGNSQPMPFHNATNGTDNAVRCCRYTAPQIAQTGVCFTEKCYNSGYGLGVFLPGNTSYACVMNGVGLQVRQ